jgi:hypothetical protein
MAQGNSREKGSSETFGKQVITSEGGCGEEAPNTIQARPIFGDAAKGSGEPGTS